MPMYQERRVQLRFVTPAFLGGAEGSAELRTPPFKSLLRRWWRVAHVRGQAPDVARMREVEGRLFGHTWLKEDHHVYASRSLIRMVLESWSPGTLATWPEPDPIVSHPEVEGRSLTGAHLYLGYGPLVHVKGRGTSLNPERGSAIADGTECELRFRYLEADGEQFRLANVLLLWNWFGTIGSRCRNGWGSVAVKDSQDSKGWDEGMLLPFSRDLEECLDSDWPHAIGKEGSKLLLWRTRRQYDTWSEAMKALAEAKIRFRTSFPFQSNRDVENPVLEERHILSYPVTNHGVLGWSERDRSGRPILTRRGQLKQSERLANQVLFKIQRRDGTGRRKYQGIAVHMPHAVPRTLLKELEREEEAMRKMQLRVWRSVHAVLDEVLERWR